MDSEDDEVSTSERTTKRGYLAVTMRWCAVLLIPVVSFFLVTVSLSLVAVFVANSSITSPISLRSQCKIVSSSVDLRSSKVCELGLLNYKAKNVFYPYERNKFRCRYDYYWASVFKVEMKDRFSGKARVALAEAPNEALPHKCRPNFGAAWLAKDKFKVNETYGCWYSSDISTVSLDYDGFSSCQAQEPTKVEMIKRYYFLCTKLLLSWYSSKERTIFWRWDMLAGLMTGFSTSLITITVLRVLQPLVPWMLRYFTTRFFIHLNRACFLVAYFSFVGWLIIQYGKRLSLPEIFNILKSRLWSSD
ncbi:uncharacterized protein LOC111800848 [Cucurbita pepo subsp. pepo]|uniref:uncharacterized protein LOC111800848 n=1 Tax=Cucurbita pepo subsp. pepo TaxID=3664 RepID=UPI000C9D7B90|nr:uncharacterized protein LOC111800848 [Cucurbita pepo subsp. pepo]